jgi:hypothetical protein
MYKINAISARLPVHPGRRVFTYMEVLTPINKL